MREVVVPLGVSQIRQLTRKLKQLAVDLNPGHQGLNIPGFVERATGEELAHLVRVSIPADVDGNYAGTDNPNASVKALERLGHIDVVWRGRQIKYVEFGTGAVGQGYPGVAMAATGYHPDPTKKRWFYRDAKSDEPTVSHGLPFQAPMYNAATYARLHKIWRPYVKEAVGEALHEITV